MVKQISIFLENRTGRLFEVASVLADNGLNIRALSLADTSDFGILRLILSDPDKAFDCLKKSGYTVSTTEVVAIEVPDKPGGLATILGIFQENGINIEYMYAFLGKVPDKAASGDAARAIMVFRFEDNKAFLELMKKQDIKLIDAKELYRM